VPLSDAHRALDELGMNADRSRASKDRHLVLRKEPELVYSIYMMFSFRAARTKVLKEVEGQKYYRGDR
jgi:hypothetical protein